MSCVLYDTVPLSFSALPDAIGLVPPTVASHGVVVCNFLRTPQQVPLIPHDIPRPRPILADLEQPQAKLVQHILNQRLEA